MFHRPAPFSLVTILITSSGLAQVKDIEEPQRIANAARAHALANATMSAEDVDAQVGPVDARLRVRACGHELETFTPPRARMEGRTSVGVRCRSPHPWTLYVPARIRVWKDVVVAAQTLDRGQLIGASDIRIERLDTSELMGRHYDDLQGLIGMEVKRSVAEGRALTATTVAAPKVVRRGQSVTMLAGRPGLEVRVRGKALSDGAVGDLIGVENSTTRRRLQGTVTKTGLVRVN